MCIRDRFYFSPNTPTFATAQATTNLWINHTTACQAAKSFNVNDPSLYEEDFRIYAAAPVRSTYYAGTNYFRMAPRKPHRRFVRNRTAQNLARQRPSTVMEKPGTQQRKLIGIVWPVSYTHLDVYKRQV